MKQEAIITKIEGETITANIDCAEACRGCSATAMCGTAKAKEITLHADGAQRCVGDRVVLELERGVGMAAVAWAYLIPAVLLIGLLLLLQSLGVNELISGLSALGAVVIYYVLIKVLGLGAGVSITIIEE
ncbi:MAG: SoxR reducing system RseC family protein [Mucinivorans sp.]